MAIIYGEIDCLRKLINLFNEIGVNHLSTLEQIHEYKIVCEERVKELSLIAVEEVDLRISRQRHELENYISDLKIKQLSKVRVTYVFQFLSSKIKLFFLNRALRKLEANQHKLVIAKTEELAGVYYKGKQIFDLNYNLVLGAAGEQQALNELRKLSDSYYVFNNVQLSFPKPLYEPKSRQRIYSIQADHVVVARSGIFLIETKNWSAKTSRNITDFTAFEQVKSSSFALYCYFNPRNSGFFAFFDSRRKIKIRSILLMTAHKMDGNHSFVKVLNLSQLVKYITYFPPVLTDEEIQYILNKL